MGRSRLRSEENLFYPLVQQQSQYRYHNTFKNIEGYNGEKNQSRDTVDGLVDIGTHGNDGIQRQAEELGELGQQVDGIEEAAKDGHDSCADGQAPDGAFFALFEMVADGGRKYQSAAHKEIGKVAYISGRGAFDENLDEDLQQLTDHTGNRP